MTDGFHSWYVDLSCQGGEPYCFWQRSKVIQGHQRWKSENHFCFFFIFLVIQVLVQRSCGMS
ncbi:hypothetical protein HOLleu_35010 [Holothuria leucospilota]|uniref:Uncharacterized protein n=1 Tax=Holothuria leucospilota TaxID=206669 RepID=A0A9Q0YSQ7_HOLLE|nr:hypothetical protein HOLleu_35010 [Holothuria leucospilota]